MLKVWNMQAAACKFTSDAHADRTWALAVAPKLQSGTGTEEGGATDRGRLIAASGGADGTLRIWRDQTAELRQEASRAQHRKASAEAGLAAAMSGRRYATAFSLALELEQPRRLRAILEELLDVGPRPPRPGQGSAALRFLSTATSDWVAAMHAEHACMAEESGETSISADTGSSTAESKLTASGES